MRLKNMFVHLWACYFPLLIGEVTKFSCSVSLALVSVSQLSELRNQLLTVKTHVEL